MDVLDQAKQRIIVALDVDTRDKALALVKNLRDHVGLFKVGSELLSSEGISIIREILSLGGSVFLDGKFKDIPNTVGGASRAVTRLGVNMFNVHTMGGLEMMKAAVEAVAEESSKLTIERPLVLGVTILTSIDQATMNRQLRIPGEIKTQVAHLAKLADEAGLDGVIGSPHEIEAIRRNTSREMLIVTPGVRPRWAALQDQRRVMTPRQAILKGASYIVIGRPITKPPIEIGTSVDAAKLVSEEIVDALAEQEGD